MIYTGCIQKEYQGVQRSFQEDQQRVQVVQNKKGFSWKGVETSKAEGGEPYQEQSATSQNWWRICQAENSWWAICNSTGGKMDVGSARSHSKSGKDERE